MLVKFEQNCMVQTTWNFELFDKKPGFLKNIFWQSVDALLEDIFKLKQLFDAKLLISGQPTFSVPRITVVRHM